MLKAETSTFKVEKFCAAYSEVLLWLCVEKSHGKLFTMCLQNFEDIHQLLQKLKTINEKTNLSLIFCNEIILLFGKFIYNKLYTKLIECNLEVDTLNDSIKSTVREFKPIIFDLHQTCKRLKNLFFTCFNNFFLSKSS